MSTRTWWRPVIPAALLVALASCGGAGTLEVTTTAPATSGAPAGACGDGVCDGPETAELCPEDCGEYGLHTPADFSGACGDGTCEGPEHSENCPQDCPGVADASGVVMPVDESLFYTGTDADCWDLEATGADDAADFAEGIDPATGDPGALLYFGIVVHIEPHSAYREEDRYELDAGRLRRMAEIVAAHGGRMTVQTQPPFLDTALALGDDIHRDLAAMGNEIAVHFHEDYYLGPACDDLPVSDYAAVLFDLRQRIADASGSTVENWAGGNTYPHIWEAASQAGLRTNTNYKNRYTQQSAPGFAAVNPWRPAGAEDIAARLTHDAGGSIIFVPSGVYPTQCERLEVVPRPYGHRGFDYSTVALRASLQSATPGMVNTFYLTFHPGDFMAPDDDEEDFALWDAWLTEVVDPLVAAGQVRWATIAEMADAFEAWER